MFVPKYHITHGTLKNIGIIDAAREIIQHASLIPSWETKFRRQALENMLYASTALEGNQIQYEQLQELLDGLQPSISGQDQQEVLNYRNALKLPLDFSLDYILLLHQQLTAGIYPEQSTGHFRHSQVVLKNAQTGEVSYTPPPAAEVPYLMEDLLSWINSEGKEFHPVLKAAIVHLELSRIHPFTVSNGKVARLFSWLLLVADGYDFRHFLSIDEYFHQDLLKYYLTIQSVCNQKVLDTHERDLTPWIDYYVHGVAKSAYELKERVRKTSLDSHIKDKLGEQVELNERQMAILDFLRKHKAMRNSDFRKIFPDYSDDTVLRELKFLKQKGLVQKVGGTKKAQYVLKG